MTQQDTSLLDAVARLSERVRALEEREGFIGNDVIAPAYAAPIGTDHFDSNLRNLWVNYDGTAPGWQLIGGSGSVTGSGTTPELTYWTGATTIGSATDIEFIAGGGLDFQGGANALLRVNDNAASALYISDAGGLQYIKIDSTNVQPAIVLNEGGADIDFRLESSGVPNAIMVLGSSGNVGLNVSVPGDRLSVDGNIRLQGATDRRLFFTPGVPGVATQCSLSAVTGGHIDFKNNAALSLHRFDQSGTVYVGLTPPAAKGSIVISNEHGGGGEPFVDTLMQFNRYTTNVATTGSGMQWLFRNEDSTGTLQDAAWMKVVWSNATAATRSIELYFELVNDAVTREFFSMNGLNTNPESVFNDGGYSIDFRVESALHTHAIYLDSENSWVGLTGCAVPEQAVEIEETETLEASPGDSYAAALRLDPGYDDNNNGYTVTRHNYIEFQDVQLLDTAAVTDGCAFAFDAAAGTHAAVDSGTTKATPGTVDAWIKANINGSVYYLPAYTSKTT